MRISPSNLAVFPEKRWLRSSLVARMGILFGAPALQRTDSPSCGFTFRRLRAASGDREVSRVVEEAVFQCIGRPVFFDQAVEVVMGWIRARVEQKNRKRPV